MKYFSSYNGRSITSPSSSSIAGSPSSWRNNTSVNRNIVDPPSTPIIDFSENKELNCNVDVRQLPPLNVGVGEKPLQFKYWMWCARKGKFRTMEYSKTLRLIGRCASIEQWWSLYGHLKRPTDLPAYEELSLFKYDIKPMWEDPANVNGGQWVIRLRRCNINQAWENLCLAMLGEQFEVGNEICGITLVTKPPVSRNE